MGEEQPFKDAEAWLARRGVERNPLRVPLEPPAVPDPERPPEPDGGSGSTADDAPSGPTRESAGSPEMSPREATRLAQVSEDETLRRADDNAADADRRTTPRLEDDVTEAVAFARRSTANAPQAEARIAGKLRARGWPAPVVEQTLARCRELGIVDDRAMAAALVAEGRDKGHAPRRLASDLRRRELSDEAIEAALVTDRAEDPEAAAFAVAREKAARLTGVSAETAFRRVVGHLARRGHPEALARKVAREAIFTTRDAERAAGH